ncbi:MAG TPA: hypothetical protein VL461_07140 [Dictyobacter sp.]|jgi:K+ transporter|nr:hypothetical protein [Dictyobacter sp.]
MKKGRTTKHNSTFHSLLYPEGKALEQMYGQSRFEAQCWFFTSLIVSIIGTTFVLCTILLFLQNTAFVTDSGKIALALANVVTGVIQHLIITQARSANKRADLYAKELKQDADELNMYEIIEVISSVLPEGEDRNHLIYQTIMDALFHAHEQKAIQHALLHSSSFNELEKDQK